MSDRWWMLAWTFDPGDPCDPVSQGDQENWMKSMCTYFGEQCKDGQKWGSHCDKMFKMMGTSDSAIKS